jgi:hypothetical protein
VLPLREWFVRGTANREDSDASVNRPATLEALRLQWGVFRLTCIELNSCLKYEFELLEGAAVAVNPEVVAFNLACLQVRPT